MSLGVGHLNVQLTSQLGHLKRFCGNGEGELDQIWSNYPGYARKGGGGGGRGEGGGEGEGEGEGSGKGRDVDVSD